MIAKEKRYRKFIILSSPRSGTHMLRTALRNHVDIVARSEVFNPDFLKGRPFGPQTPAKEILSKYIFRGYPRNISMVGFIIHRSGTPFGDWPDLWDMLGADPDMYVISLRRRNLLRRYLSYQVMRKFRGAPPTPLHFDAEELKKDFLYQQREVEAFDQRFSRHPLIRVYYEDLCDDYYATIKGIQKFLRVRPQELWPEVQGKPKRRLSEAISNFNELKDYFAETEWASFFNEEEDVTHVTKPGKKAPTQEKRNGLLERLSDRPEIKPYIYLRHRYKESWAGLAKMLLEEYFIGGYQKNFLRKEDYFNRLPVTGRARYSEGLEELLIRSFFQDRRNGFFLDVGCAWPVKHSTTYYLEKHLGWSGIAIDANPVREPHWNRHRPRTQLFKHIITDHFDTVDAFYKAEALGSTQENRIFKGKPVRGVETTVPTMTLSKLLDENSIKMVDFISMDIEESEVKALAGFDIKRFKPQLVCIEVSRGNKNQVMNYFATNDYEQLMGFTHWDRTNLYFAPRNILDSSVLKNDV